MNSKYTKEVFVSALNQLLKTKHIDKIRVEEICRECGLSKKTFYYHFGSKYELLTYLYNKYVTDELKEFGYEDYFSRLGKGDEQLNDISNENSAEILQRLVYLWSGAHADINKNMSSSEDYQAFQPVWRRESLNGKKQLLIQRLEKEGQETAGAGAESGCSSAEYNCRVLLCRLDEAVWGGGAQRRGRVLCKYYEPDAGLLGFTGR